MFSNDGWARKYDTAAAQALDQPVLAAVQVLRLQERAGGLPLLFLLAITPERIYALGMEGCFEPRATKVLARWDRATTEVGFDDTTVVLAPAGEDLIELQGPPGELTDRVLRALAPALEAAA